MPGYGLQNKINRLFSPLILKWFSWLFRSQNKIIFEKNENKIRVESQRNTNNSFCFRKNSTEISKPLKKCMCVSYYSLVSYLLHWSLSKCMLPYIHRGKDQHVNNSLQLTGFTLIWSHNNLNFLGISSCYLAPSEPAQGSSETAIQNNLLMC